MPTFHFDPDHVDQAAMRGRRGGRLSRSRSTGDRRAKASHSPVVLCAVARSRSRWWRHSAVCGAVRIGAASLWFEVGGYLVWRSSPDSVLDYLRALWAVQHDNSQLVSGT